MPLKKQEKPALVELITASDYRDRYIVQHYGNMTMKLAMNTNAPTIHKWARQQGEEKMIMAIAKLFIGASLYFDKPISQDAAEGIVVKLLADYELSNLKLEDLVVCCKEITEAEAYGKLTPNKILSHIKKYKERRMRAAIDGSLDSVAQSKLYDTNMHGRLHDTLRATAKDKSTAVDKTRNDVRKYYK